MNLKDTIYFNWYKTQIKAGNDTSKESFEDYINSLSKTELLQEISYILGDIPE